MVVLGTGASEKDGLKESETLCCSFLKDLFLHVLSMAVANPMKPGLFFVVVSSARYTLRYLWEHWAQLSEFEPLQQVPLTEARGLLEAILVLDVATQNTDQEVREGLRNPAVFCFVVCVCVCVFVFVLGATRVSFEFFVVSATEE